MSEQVKRWVSEAGLDCAVNYTQFSGYGGHWCGYVRVPTGHPLHGLAYSADVPEAMSAKVSEVMDGTVGKRGVMAIFLADKEHPRIDLLFDVHGSLTYSRPYAPGQEKVDGEWWYGFDCGHCDDSPEIQDYAYTRAECESLATQISALAMENAND